MQFEVEFYAGLAQQAGSETQCVHAETGDLRAIYAALRVELGLTFPEALLKPVCNNRMVSWDFIATDGDVLAFLPPFSGG